MEQQVPEHLTVSVEHLRRNLPTIMAKVEGGGATVTLTRYGREVGQLTPIIKPPECGHPLGDYTCGLKPGHKGAHLPF